MAKAKQEGYAYGAVLEALSKGLYPDKRHVLREFVQNAFDALRDLRTVDQDSLIRPIEIRIDPPCITIHDEGMGMDEHRMQQYRYLGYSEKDHRTRVGFRGIGKFSGSAIAKRIIVTSTTKGSNTGRRVEIDAEGMFARLRKDRNPLLENVLEEHSTIDVMQDESPDDHYTFVELHGILPDSESLFDSELVGSYLSSTVPVPYDPASPYSKRILKKLQAHVPDFFQSELKVNDQRISKRFPANIGSPQFIPIYGTERENSPLMAFCWYAKHEVGKQLPQKDLRGLTYRVKNFAVGDQYTTRRDLWATTPHLAFHFFGEIHLCCSDLVPTSDRTDIEDNRARKEMHDRCRRISQRLSREAQAESEERRFAYSLQNMRGLVDKVQQDKESGVLGVAERESVEFSIRQAVQDVKKRVKRLGRKRRTPNERKFVREADEIVRHAEKLLAQLRMNAGQLFDVTKAVNMGEDARGVLAIVIEVLNEEFGANHSLYQKLVRRISIRIKEAFS